MTVLQPTKIEFNLRSLLEGIIPSVDFLDTKVKPCTISGLSIDSRRLQEGDLFIACKGTQADGRDYIDNAISRGAAAVLAEAWDEDLGIQHHLSSKRSVPIIHIPFLSNYIGSIAARFYGEPSTHLEVIGFTGTNGKTSCTQFLAQALSKLNKPCGIIGTLGAGFPDNLKITGEVTGLTTPDPITLQRQLVTIKAEGAQAVAMEVSSHGLSQNRIQGVMFNTAVFTNLTPDHLDYHKTMEDYAYAKKQLFMQPGLRSAVFNMDDPHGRELAKEFRNKLTVYGYSITGQSAYIKMLSANNIHMTAKGFSADVETPWGKGELSSTLLGQFNVSNLLSVLAVLCIMGVPLNDALKSLASVKTVAGRMETFGGDKQPLVVVDYAHTPDALEKTLLTLREYCQRKLWCIFGCGGDRDSSKRKLMGQIAEQYSDQLIITDDNPRLEDPEKITNDIITGLLCPWAALIEHDRGAAIAHAIQSAMPGDVVLIAGRGHEDYQIIGHDKIPFNDAEQVQLQLSLKS